MKGNSVRHPTPQGYDLIRRFEGAQAKPYRCPAGLWTIGYGHVIRPGEVFPPEGISREQAEVLLVQDAALAARAVLRFISVPLSDGQFDALVSFTFNLGAGALQRSTLRRKVNRGEHADAAEEFLRWVWSGGRKLPGLIRRRKAEKTCYLS